MNERLKIVRKTLSLTQKDFGAALGVTRDTYASYESGRVVPSNTFIQLLCSKYNINEDWLRCGNGEMFVRSKRTILESLAESYDLNNKERAIIEAFLDLSPQGRAGVLEYVEKLVESVSSSGRNEAIAQRITDTTKMIEISEKEQIQL